jgi:hypothetical protein
MQANLSDAELSEKLKPLNKKVHIFFTLGSIFMYVVLVEGIISIILLLLVAVAEWSFSTNFPLHMMLFALVTLICGIIAIIFKKIGLGYGDEMVRLTLNMAEGILKTNFDLKKFCPDSYISRDEVHKAKLFNWSGIEGWNLFHANYRGADFVSSDLHLTVHMNNQTHDVFTGQWLVITMDKEITPSVTVTEKKKKNLINDKREKVQMESAAFNKQFMVFTEDPQKAFYVLTPHFMEFIMSLKQSTESKIHLCFTGYTAHVAVSTGRASFAPYQEEHDIANLRRRMQREIDFIRRVIDGFLQNERLFGLSRTA